MDRQAQDYAAAMAFAQQQQAGLQQQQQQYGFHPQPQQFPPPYLPPHPSLQQFPYHRQMPPQQQLYPQHHHPMMHLQQQQQPSPAFAPHLPPHLISPSPFAHPFESAPPPAATPSDLELQKRIDKMVEYAAKNGPEFEALIREKQQDNPDYSFLFGAEGHSYYRYKLWLTTRAINPNYNPSFPPSSMPVMPSSHSPTLNGSPLNPPSMGVAAGPPASMLPSSQMHRPSFPPFYDQHQQPLHSQPFLSQTRTDYEPTTKGFKGLSGPLPSDVAVELNSVLSNLNGTKDSIKGAKMWFMQRSPFAPALAEALRDRMFALDDSERQLHIIFLANDILFDSLQRRLNLQDLDNEALAFKPVLGPMLARAYNNPINKDENQSRLERILDFWTAKEVYDKETIASLEKEMTGGMPLRSAVIKEAPPMTDPSGYSGLHQIPLHLHQSSIPTSSDYPETQKQLAPTPAAPSQFISALNLPGSIYPPAAQASFPGALPVPPASQATPQPHLPHLLPGSTPSTTEQTPPPYPLFPPGLIPGMVRKMQIGSGVPYSPLSPLDIPTAIPPSTVGPSEILERVSKFFKEIGEVNPSEGPMKRSGSESSDEDDGYEGEHLARKGGACIPPPPNLQLVDPETGMYADGTVDRKPGSSGSGRLGLGASADPNEVSQYDDVYSSYRKQRSTNYHSSMSARAGTR